MIPGRGNTMSRVDVEEAARQLAGNWRKFESFAWHRAGELGDAENWTIYYTSGRDAGLLAQSNHAAIAQRMAPFMAGDDPDVVAERHSHWAVGYLDGFSIRVYRPDGRITPAFEELHRILEDLDNYPILNESDYSDREYQATLENYRNELWELKGDLPEGWEGAGYSYFSDRGQDRFIENRDDQGGWAPKAKLIEALQDLGLLPAVVVETKPS